MKTPQKVSWFGLLVACVVLSSGCMSAYIKSVGGDTEQLFSRIFFAEYNVVWEASVDALKASPMEVVNRESGTLQTKWIDNTAEKNLIDSVGSVIPYSKAQYRFRVSLSKGTLEGRNSVRLIVQKEQQIQRDVLEGWRNQETEGIQENSLIYRVSKLIEFKLKIEKMEEQKIKKAMQSL